VILKVIEIFPFYKENIKIKLYTTSYPAGYIALPRFVGDGESNVDESIQA
jgi:hypothetical protein